MTTDDTRQRRVNPISAARDPKLCQQAIFSTDGVPEHERFDAWRSLIGLTHELTTDAPSFSARLRSTQVGEMLVHVMDASAQAVHRTRERVRRDGLDHFVLHVSAVSQGVTEGDRELFIPAGAVSINDVSRSHRREAAPERGSLIVSLPRDLLAEALPNLDGMHGRVLHHGLGGLMRDHVVALAAHSRHVTREAAPNLVSATTKLLAACLHPSTENRERARSSLDAALFVRAKRYIERHLGSRELTPEAICIAMGVSRPTLFRAFRLHGGVAAYIWERRVHAVRRALVTGFPEPIAAIGYRYGFTSDVHLSRSFRRQFGMSPTEFKAERVRGAGAVPDTSPAGQLFAGWVRAHG